jgi:hypothetical protein
MSQDDRFERLCREFSSLEDIDQDRALREAEELRNNPYGGNRLREEAKRYFTEKEPIPALVSEASVPIGFSTLEKPHRFDLGNETALVICKSHTWTEQGNPPEEKLLTWTEAMYYFHITPGSFKKIFFVLRDFNKERGQTLLRYYIETRAHIIPQDVSLYEWDPSSGGCSIYHFNRGQWYPLDT